MRWQDLDSYVRYFSIFCNQLGYFDSILEEAAERAGATSVAQQRIKAECPPISEMEFESELELDGFEAAAGAWEEEKIHARLEADFVGNN
jgi:hypothetical protein